MKRFLIVLLTLSLFVPCAFAESIDLKSMTTDDLVALRDAVNAELAKRNFAEKEVVVPLGNYIVGEDIPVGTYTVLPGGSITSMVTVYNQRGDVVAYYTMTPSSSIGKLRLQEWQVVEVRFEPVIFTPYAGLGF